MARDSAILLRRTPFGESSLVVQALTRSHGRVHLLAKGAYRTTSRFFAVLDLFHTLELDWSGSRERDLYPLREARLVTRRRGIPDDLFAYRAGHAVLELCDLAARHAQPEPGLYDAAVRAFDALDANVGDAAADLVLVVFELAFLHTLGLSPALVNCAACGGPAPPVSDDGVRAAFSAGAGGRLCRECAQEARSSGRRVGTLPAPVLEAAARLRDAPLEDVARLDPGPDLRHRLRDFLERFLDYHLETRPRFARRFLAAPNRNAPGAGVPRLDPTTP